MRNSLLFVGIVALFLGILTGCPKPQEKAKSDTPAYASKGDKGGAGGELTLYVPCGMIIPIRSVMDKFRADHPGVKMNGVFDNGGVLVKRIIDKGERPDLFVSPGSIEMKKLEDKGLVDAAARKAIGDFELVIITHRENPIEINGPEDLKKCKTLSIPDPEVNSVGASGKEALVKLGLWDELQPKFIKPFPEHAIVSHTMVANGKSDAGISYKNCPLETNPEKLAISKVKIAFTFPPDTYTKQQCLIAIMKSAKNRPVADQFLAFITSPEGRKILSDKGMTGCLNNMEACPTPAGGQAAAPATKAIVTVRAFYPGNEDHAHIRKWMEGLSQKYGGKVSGEFTDFTSDEGFKKWQAAGLSCGAILINDKQTWTYEKDGKPVEVTFKMRDGGEWKEEDLYAVIDKLLKENGGS